MNRKVDFYFNKESQWQEAILQLRSIILECQLTEELKWGTPCYTLGKKNIVLIHEFKEYCALLFFKGSLLSNADGILFQQTENTQASRQIRFTKAKEVLKIKNEIRAYIFEAIEIEKSGAKIQYKKTEDYEVPEELQIKLDKIPQLKKAFYALTPGRQRGYLLHFSSAKQSKTRESRVEKCIPDILNGIGYGELSLKRNRK